MVVSEPSWFWHSPNYTTQTSCWVIPHIPRSLTLISYPEFARPCGLYSTIGTCMAKYMETIGAMVGFRVRVVVSGRASTHFVW